MFNERLFRATVVLNGMTLGMLASQIGINDATLQRKMKNNGSFNRDEIAKIAEILHLSDKDIIDIFFATELTET